MPGHSVVSFLEPFKSERGNLDLPGNLHAGSQFMLLKVQFIFYFCSKSYSDVFMDIHWNLSGYKIS